jgi:Phosphotransferase enzyme family
MQPTVIETVEQVDASWLAHVLGHAGVDATVRSVTTDRVGTGQMGSCFRLHIDYANGAGPAQLIVKLPATEADSRAAGMLGYRCETSFYRELADRISTRIPRCFFTAFDESTNGFTLVLEDLAPAEPGDQIAGCTIDEALAAAVNVAGLHAATWNDPSIRELGWLIPDLTAMPEFTAELLVKATDQFLQRYPVEPSTASVLRSFTERFGAWATGRSEPYSLLHSDYRLDNLLFAPASANDPVIAVDWQVVTVGLPLRDVAFLLATGLSPADRRAGERGIVEAYHRRLGQLGVTDYDAQRCWNDYRYALFQAPFITVLGAFVGQRTERGDRMFTVMADRSATAIDDLDALSLLEE